jgi:predicted permease
MPIDGREIGALRPLPRTSPPRRRDFQIVARLPSASASGAVRDRLLEATRHLGLQGEPSSGHGEPSQPFDDVRLVPIGTHLAAKERPAFALVFAAAALLLFLACVNVAGLVAARNIDRRRELAVRRALGAAQWRLLRGIIFELGLLTGASVGLAFLLARPILIVTLELLPASIAVLKEPAIDSRVVIAAASFATVCLIVVSLWPMLVTTRVGVAALLGSQSTSTPRRRRSSAALIASQVALGFALLTAGGLSIASLAEAYRNDAGYRRDHAILLELFHTRAFGPTDSIEALRALPGLIEQLPGVSRVAVSTINPLFQSRSNASTNVVPEGWSGPIEGVVSRHVSESFFEVLGLRLVDGRWPGAGEWKVDQPVALVSESAARVLWPDRPALGRTLVPRSSRLKSTWTVIGVVADARYSGLDADPLGDIYLPDPLASGGRTGAFFHVQTTEPAGAVLPVILASLPGRGFRIEQASTHEAALFASVKHRVLPAWLFGTLGFGALLLTGVGVLGLLAMSAAQRTREVGIRIAIGATPSRVVREFLREQMGAVLVGLAAGMLVSAVAARFIEAHLYRISPFDPLVWAIGAVTVLGVAAAGAWIPSTRASRVDPVQALRAE